MTQSGMTSRFVALCFDANDPLRLARFWADALHWEIDDETHDEIGLVPTDDTRFRIEFQAVPEHKAGKNRIHLDLTSTSIDDHLCWRTPGRQRALTPMEQAGRASQKFQTDAEARGPQDDKRWRQSFPGPRHESQADGNDSDDHHWQDKSSR